MVAARGKDKYPVQMDRSHTMLFRRFLVKYDGPKTTYDYWALYRSSQPFFSNVS
jgi:hypothetical protein